MKCAFAVAAMLLVAPSLEAQTIKVMDYFPSNVGDSWSYKNNVKDGQSAILIHVSQKAEFSGLTVFQRDENNGDHRYQTVDGSKGLAIHHLYFKGDRTIDYPSPMVVFPAAMKLGDKHHAEGAYTTMDKGQVTEKGTQTYDTTFEAVEDTDTPLGVFKNCAVLRTRALRTTPDGAQKGYNLREWHAKGVGPVKVMGELSWVTPGKPNRSFQVDAALQTATVAAKAVRASR